MTMTETANTEWRQWPPTPETPVTPEATERDPEVISEQGRSAEKPSETPETPDNPRNENSAEDLLLGLLSRWQSVFRLPDIVTEDRPSLRRVIKYSFEGEWGPEGGQVRTMAKIDAILFAIPLVTVLYTLAWIAQRPARRVITAILVGVIGWFMGWWG